MQKQKMDFDLAGNDFFRHPHSGAVFGGGYCHAGVGLAGIIEVCNIFITPTIYLLLNIFMLALGALMLFFSGRVWAGDSAPENREIAVCGNAFFSYPRY
ncbi:membrane protein; ATP binding protein of ABC transporter [Escherichia coli]|uniref:Membrane protein ATP binding protein of ABC transporter n=1 Tax=Escherichia coli TaxID=562 RepID=A0A2X1JHD0_ECOLX|nr:membrane protein; ATP binding protein of ABC transporter [Escherichia coli]